MRYERFNTQEDVPAGFVPDETRNRTVVTAGINFFPHPNVVFKVEFCKWLYRQFDSKGGELPELNDLNIGVGFAF